MKIIVRGKKTASFPSQIFEKVSKVFFGTEQYIGWQGKTNDVLLRFKSAQEEYIFLWHVLSGFEVVPDGTTLEQFVPTNLRLHGE